MSWLWFAIPVAVGLFGLLGVVTGVGHVARGRLAKGGGNVIGGGLVAALGLAGSLLGLNVQTYSRLTYEHPVAQVSIRSVDPAQKLYNVTVTRSDGGPTQTCSIQGDEWILSGRVQKWKPWANIVGLDSTYALDQVGNKYFTAPEPNTKYITACDLVSSANPVDQYVPKGMVDGALSMAQVEDRKFGSANYMPLADGAVYNVIMTQSGFNAESANDIAKKANAERPGG